MRRLVVIGIIGLLAAPAQAQTDDRIFNDVFTVLRGETLLARTRQLCLDMADMDLEADFVDWTERNVAILRLAEQLMDERPGLDMDAYVQMRMEAAQEAGRTFSRERDPAAYCESLGEAMAGEQVDLVAWFPRETSRMVEAAEGKWPVLDLTDSVPVAEALATKKIFAAMADAYVRCGVFDPPAGTYEAAASEWQARNSYTQQLADQVLANWGALAPQRWADARDEAGAEVDAIFADSAGVPDYCRSLVDRLDSGEIDVDQLRPDLFESVMKNAEIVP